MNFNVTSVTIVTDVTKEVKYLKWLLFVYKVPTDSSTARVTVWRKVKKLGALYLQQTVCIVPYTEKFIRDIEKLKEEIIAFGGYFKSFEANTTEDQMEKDIIAEFNKQRKVEYMEIKEQCEAFFEEIKKEIERSNLTFAELEENEDELDKLHKWFDKVSERDIFGTDMKEEIKSLLNRADKEFEYFASLVYENEKNK